jgi:cardiolipin synthase
MSPPLIPPQPTIVSQLSDLARAVADTGHLDTVCTALETGRLTRQSAGPIREAIAAGAPNLEAHLRNLQRAWNVAPIDVTGDALALVLRTSAATEARAREGQPKTFIVWTGPKVEGSFFRATREVVRELLLSARTHILVVGYWVAAAPGDGEGVIEELLRLLADALSRGMRVTVIMDERTRPDGLDNRAVITSSWPVGSPLPQLLTWHLPIAERHLKLHAKVIVIDRPRRKSAPRSLRTWRRSPLKPMLLSEPIAHSLA